MYFQDNEACRYEAIEMRREVNPKETRRAEAYELWMKAPNPMVTIFKTIDVTRIVKVSKKRGLKFNMLLDWCIGRAASSVKEFYLLPVGDKLISCRRGNKERLLVIEMSH